ncbi:hypothetical protein ACFCW2_08755 [Qipengyuania sp. DSG2-2]|uniref:hypothetical protein n=1 Tax=Qipengyuania sp. DGS2-2 TaxID=3349631 RepID=UPI0036D38C35
MADNRDEIHIEDDDAMAGVKTGAMRWVLGISLLLAIIAMSAVWIIPALFQGDVEEEATMTGSINSAAETGDSTDSIVIEDADEIEGASDAGPGLIENEAAS